MPTLPFAIPISPLPDRFGRYTAAPAAFKRNVMINAGACSVLRMFYSENRLPLFRNMRLAVFLVYALSPIVIRYRRSGPGGGEAQCTLGSPE
jgi:hypothetical protein